MLTHFLDNECGDTRNVKKLMSKTDLLKITS